MNFLTTSDRLIPSNVVEQDQTPVRSGPRGVERSEAPGDVRRVHGGAGLHHWSTSTWTTRSTRRWPVRDQIIVTLLADGGVRVVDNGRGIPVDIVESEGKPAVTVVLTVLHAGGKFGGGGYKVSGGLHGVGVSVVNALSRRLQVDVDRGKVYTQSFTIGVPDADLAEVGTRTPNGTTITFWASPDVFEATTYTYETISTRFRESLPQPGPRVVSGRAPGPRPTQAAGRQIFKFDDGLVDFVKYLAGTRAVTAT